MSPSHSRHSSPAPSEDDIVSVFLRIPPDEPARLVRASLVCKAWRRILTGPDFCRLYREFHATPPMLGFTASFWSRGGDLVSKFISTTAFRLSEDLDFYSQTWMAVDSRHGRILVELADNNGESTDAYVVWDPITGGHWGVQMPSIHCESWTGAVLCAKEQCDHLGCHGPPFLVAMVTSDHLTTSACVYSSESGVWSDIITLNRGDEINCNGRSILVGNTLYFPFTNYNLLQYNLGEQKLYVIDVPVVDTDEHLVFISAENDVLVFVGLQGTRLSLWSIEAGALAWAKRTLIDLENLLPPRAFEPRVDVFDCEPRVDDSDSDSEPRVDDSDSDSEPRADDSDSDSEDERVPYVCGFAQGTVFLSTKAGLFTVELNSGRTKKVAGVKIGLNVIPLMGFYTQDHARRVMPRP